MFELQGRVFLFFVVLKKVLEIGHLLQKKMSYKEN